MFENYKVFNYEYAGRPLKVEVGKVAGLANGSCMISYGETVILACATASPSPVTALTSSLFPLTMMKSSILSARFPADSFAAKASPPKKQFLPAV